MPHKDPEVRRRYLNEYNNRNRERRSKQKAEYRSRTIERRRQYDADYRVQNRERLNASNKRWRLANRERQAAYLKEWGKCHREEINRKQRERIASDLVHRVRCYLRYRLSAAVRKGHKGASAVRDLGCTLNEFIWHIGSQFGEGMSWENWGEWHLDHIKPLASFDLTDRAQCLAACHYTNIRPLWAHENMSKGAREVA